ncbi:hypothetical protein DFH06DRAFT_1316832 [Mycena polygramma]|nr:hypothetical protein DFH06DRAFT_1316832 [Mycena polygramma]
MAPLLARRAFHRIALRLFYRTLVHSKSQSAALLETLRARPELAKAARTLALPNPCADDAELIRLLLCLWDLDITLPPPNSPNADPDVLVVAVRNLRTLPTLAVRKGAGTYLSQPTPRARLYVSPELTSTTLAFPLSADPALMRLASALSAAPALQTLRTPLPSAWSPAYVSVASNPVLAHICLGEEAHTHQPRGCPTAASPPLLRLTPPPPCPTPQHTNTAPSSPPPSSYTLRAPTRGSSSLSRLGCTSVRTWQRGGEDGRRLLGRLPTLVGGEEGFGYKPMYIKVRCPSFPLLRPPSAAPLCALPQFFDVASQLTPSATLAWKRWQQLVVLRGETLPAHLNPELVLTAAA